jgi:hypothetical protein
VSKDKQKLPLCSARRESSGDQCEACMYREVPPHIDTREWGASSSARRYKRLPPTLLYSSYVCTICPRCFSIIGRWPSLGSPADPRLAIYLPTEKHRAGDDPPRLTGTAWRPTYHDLGVSLIAARVAADRPLSKVSSWKTPSV